MRGGRAAHDGGPGRHVSDDDRTSADDRVLAHAPTLQDVCAEPHMGGRPHLDAAAEHAPARQVDVIADQTVMFNDRTAVYDHIYAQGGAGGNYRRCEHDRGITQARRSRHIRSPVDHDRGAEPDRLEPCVELRTRPVVANPADTKARRAASLTKQPLKAIIVAYDRHAIE